MDPTRRAPLRVAITTCVAQDRKRKTVFSPRLLGIEMNSPASIGEVRSLQNELTAGQSAQT